jgi:hypothetical protein
MKEGFKTLIVDSQGTEKLIKPRQTFEADKKIPIIDEQSMMAHLIEARRIYKEMEVGQREATVELRTPYPDLPAYIWLNTDDHIGSVMTDYESFMRDFNTVKNRPNFSLISNGDEIDHFMTINKASGGVYENPMSPQQQGRLFQKMFKGMDDLDKIIAFSFGNHNQWLRGAGYKFENTWLENFKAPVLNCGGVVTIKYGSQEYKVAISHMHWGSSKLNPTNACKRMLEHDYPEADIIFLGHTHQKEVLHFNRAGKDHVGVIGGTYKTSDEFGSEHGYGSCRGNIGGITLAIFPDTKKIVPFYSIQEAEEDLLLRLEVKNKYETLRQPISK